MRIKCLVCDALARPVYWCAAQSPHIVDIHLIQRGLHNTPMELRAVLQEQIDQTKGYDRIVLVYGLCGQSTAGLVARSIPLVIPRCHDCITLFLGSRERYNDQFNNYSGTYWYVQDYIERDDNSGGALSLGAAAAVDVQKEYDSYVQKYGKDNADYLMEIMGGWQNHYRRAAFIDMGVSNSTAVEEQAKSTAARRGWTYDRVAGDLVLLRRLLWGDGDDQWDEKDFLTVQPGQSIQMSYDENVIKVG